MLNDIVSLQFPSHVFHLSESIDDSLLFNLFTDVTFVSGDGKYYRAHKIVLISCSSVFGNMFESHKDKDQELFIYFPEVPHHYLKAMLDTLANWYLKVPRSEN